MKRTKEGVIETGVDIKPVNGDIQSDELLTPKQKFAALIEAYKKQNPTKYEQKKGELDAQLNSL